MYCNIVEETKMDDVVLLELERLRQQLVIASIDVSKAYGCNPNDYLHDLSTRDYYEEIEEGLKTS